MLAPLCILPDLLGQSRRENGKIQNLNNKTTPTFTHAQFWYCNNSSLQYHKLSWKNKEKENTRMQKSSLNNSINLSFPSPVLRSGLWSGCNSDPALASLEATVFSLVQNLKLNVEMQICVSPRCLVLIDLGFHLLSWNIFIITNVFWGRDQMSDRHTGNRTVQFDIFWFHRLLIMRLSTHVLAEKHWFLGTCHPFLG